MQYCEEESSLGITPYFCKDENKTPFDLSDQ
jgi:hypothetical protein